MHLIFSASAISFLLNFTYNMTLFLTLKQYNKHILIARKYPFDAPDKLAACVLLPIEMGHHFCWDHRCCGLKGDTSHRISFHATLEFWGCDKKNDFDYGDHHDLFSSEFLQPLRM